MRILVCGSRDWDDREPIDDALEMYNHSPGVVIHGGARGADQLAGEIAFDMGFEVEVFPADWKLHGKSAGVIRNQQMLDEGKPDIVLAFQKNNSRGTQDMINRARKAGVPVTIWR